MTVTEWRVVRTGRDPSRVAMTKRTNMVLAWFARSYKWVAVVPVIMLTVLVLSESRSQRSGSAGALDNEVDSLLSRLGVMLDSVEKGVHALDKQEENPAPSTHPNSAHPVGQKAEEEKHVPPDAKNDKPTEPSPSTGNEPNSKQKTADPAAKISTVTEPIESHDFDFTKLTKESCEPFLKLKAPAETPALPLSSKEVLRVRCVMAHGDVVNAEPSSGASSLKVLYTFSSGDRAIGKRITYQMKGSTEPSPIIHGLSRLQGYGEWLAYYFTAAMGYSYLRLPNVGRFVSQEQLATMWPMGDVDPDIERYTSLWLSIMYFHPGVECNHHENIPLRKYWHQGKAYGGLFPAFNGSVDASNANYLGRMSVFYGLSYLLDDEDTFTPSNSCGTRPGSTYNDYRDVYWFLLDMGLSFRGLSAHRMDDGTWKNLPEWSKRQASILNSSREGYTGYYRCPAMMYLSDCEQIPEYGMHIHNYRPHCRLSDEHLDRCERGEGLYACRFDATFYDRVQTWATGDGNDLLAKVRNAFDTDSATKDLFPARLFATMKGLFVVDLAELAALVSIRAQNVKGHVDRCIETFGRDDVLGVFAEKEVWKR